MPTINYITINGIIEGETSAGTAIDYLSDGLGSVTLTADQDGQQANAYRYKPFGELLAKTGTEIDPKFLWNGASGYVSGPITNVAYVRFRHYATPYGVWTSADPIDKSKGLLSNYVYAAENPIRYLDPFGLTPITCGSYSPCSPDKLNKLKACCQKLPQPLTDDIQQLIRDCVNNTWPGLGQFVDVVLSEIAARCGKKDFAVNCPPTSQPGPLPGWPPQCTTNPCSPNAKGEPTFAVTKTCNSTSPGLEAAGRELGLTEVGLCPIEPIIYVQGKPHIPGGCNCEISCSTGCAISLCPELPIGQTCEAVYHELVHCAGLVHRFGGRNENDFVYVVGRCIDAAVNKR